MLRLWLRRARPRNNRESQTGLPGVAEGEAWMYTNWQKRYQIWSGTTLISGIKAEKLCPKSKTNHESPKILKHEKRIRGKGYFVLSYFRVFVIKNKIRHNSSVEKHESQISNFCFLISTFRERLHFI